MATSSTAASSIECRICSWNHCPALNICGANSRHLATTCQRAPVGNSRHDCRSRRQLDCFPDPGRCHASACWTNVFAACLHRCNLATAKRCSTSRKRDQRTGTRTAGFWHRLVGCLGHVASSPTTNKSYSSNDQSDLGRCGRRQCALPIMDRRCTEREQSGGLRKSAGRRHASSSWSKPRPRCQQRSQCGKRATGPGAFRGRNNTWGKRCRICSFSRKGKPAIRATRTISPAIGINAIGI